MQRQRGLSIEDREDETRQRSQKGKDVQGQKVRQEETWKDGSRLEEEEERKHRPTSANSGLV